MTKTTNRQKILICDDEEGIRESLKLILDDKFDLFITTNADQCLEIVKNTPHIDLILLDIKMPKVHGIEALAAIREVNTDVKVVMITGYKSVETATEASRLGASGYIVKPFDRAMILEMAEQQLGA